MTSPTRPVMRYHGGKWKLAPWIISHFPKHRIYTESFGGAGSVLLRKPRCYGEVYNDLDGEVVNLFRVLRDWETADELAWQIALTPFARDEFVQSYLVASGPVEQARRTLVRSFMGFGSNSHNRETGFRSNTSRSYTTPAHDWQHFPAQVPAIVERLRGVVIENRPAAEVIRQHDSPETLHYVDPPYVHETRGQNMGENYRHEMTDDQHRELATLLHSVRGMVVLSGYPCPLYDELYADWKRVERKAFADGARERVECLWINPAAQVRDLFTTQEQQ